MRFKYSHSIPYAKALFDLALASQQLNLWAKGLDALAQVAIECRKKRVLSNPRVTADQKLDFFHDLFGVFSGAENLVRLLLQYKKLNLLPQIALSFQQLVNDYEKTLVVEVIVAHSLSVEQQKKIIEVLEKKYRRKIALDCRIDPHLIGGIIVRIDDQVIDGSIRGKLKRLAVTLE